MATVIRYADWRGETQPSLLRQSLRLMSEGSVLLPSFAIGLLLLFIFATPFVGALLLAFILWGLCVRTSRPTGEVLALMDAPSRVPQYPVDVGIWRDGVFIGDDEGIAMIVSGSLVFTGLHTEFSLSGEVVEGFDSPLRRWRTMEDAYLRAKGIRPDGTRRYESMAVSEAYPLRLSLADESLVEIGLRPYPSSEGASKHLEDLRASLDDSLADLEPRALRIAGWPISPRYDPLRLFGDFLYHVLFTPVPFFRTFAGVQHPFALLFDEWATNHWGSDEYVVLPPIRPQRQAFVVARYACATHVAGTLLVFLAGCACFLGGGSFAVGPMPVYGVILFALTLIGFVTFPARVLAMRKLRHFVKQPADQAFPASRASRPSS